MIDILKIATEQKSSFILFFGAIFLVLCQGCSTNGRVVPTRTPLPTWTSTPAAVAVSSGESQNSTSQQSENSESLPADSSVAQATAVPTAVATSTPIPPTATLAPTNTPVPTPTPQPTALPTATNTPVPTPDFEFGLESAERFPTESLAQNVVRVFVYVYSPIEFALADYTIAVEHNGTALNVDAVSTNGLPEQTRAEPSAYTRFTNLNVIFVEPQVGEWSIQLLGLQGDPAGPKADFELTADEITRELYVRYRKR